MGNQVAVVSVTNQNTTVAPATVAGLANLGLYTGVVNVKTDYGAKGDGTTDDTTAIQNALSAVKAGGVLVFPPATYKITATAAFALTLTKANVTILGYGATLAQANTNAGGLKTTASGTSVYGLTISGPDSASSAQTTNGIGFYALGVYTSYLTNITLVDCVFTGFSLYGSLLEFVDGFEERGNRVSNIVNAGMQHLSCQHGRTIGNRVDTIGATTSTYGIAFSRRTSDSGNLTTQPNSADIVCSGNVVTNVTFWEGLDTHSGQRIVFTGNIVRGCFVGLGMGPSKNSAGTDSYAPVDCLASDNLFDSALTNGTAGNGINHAGASGALATGCAFIGNTIRGYGLDANLLTNAAVAFTYTQSCRFIANLLIEPSPVGILWYHDNYGFSCLDNTIQDVWSASLTVAPAIEFNSTLNDGLVQGNRVATATKSATYVNLTGIRVDNTQGLINLGPNDLRAATNPFVNASGSTVYIGPNSITKASVGDSDTTLTVGASSEVQCYATTLTANRTVTLSTTGAYDGARFRVIRTGLGNFTLNVGGLKTIANATAAFVDVVYRAGAWQLAAYGTL